MDAKWINNTMHTIIMSYLVIWSVSQLKHPIILCRTVASKALDSLQSSLGDLSARAIELEKKGSFGNGGSDQVPHAWFGANISESTVSFEKKMCSCIPYTEEVHVIQLQPINSVSVFLVTRKVARLLD